MKVLLSAYACEPDKGSEPGTGWAWARAAASENDVWLLTRANNRTKIEAAMQQEPTLRLRPIYIDLPAWAHWWKRGPGGVHIYYFIWQKIARRRAKILHREERFDVAHHITFATDWLPAGVVGIRGLPAVWGPVGGTAPFPWALRRYLGMRGLAQELARVIIGGIGRRVFGDQMARSAAVVVAQNSEVARRFKRQNPIVEPNVAIRFDRSTRPPSLRSETDLVFVGRLVPWKGVAIAIDALTAPGMEGRKLTVIGAGPDRSRLRRRAENLGLANRVLFAGQLSRSEVSSFLEHSNALAFPSMHDSAGWAVAEAVAASRPVVTLALCGPQVIVERAGGGCSVAATKDASQAVARAIRLATAPTSPESVSDARLPSLLREWYGSAGSSGSTGL